MAEADRLVVSFTIEHRATGFWLRNAARHASAWHGPYADTETVAEMLCFTTREELLE